MFARKAAAHQSLRLHHLPVSHAPRVLRAGFSERAVLRGPQGAPAPSGSGRVTGVRAGSMSAQKGARQTSPAQATSSASSSSTPAEIEMPAFSFKDLGASRTVKVVIITFLSIAGSIESYMWYRWIVSTYYGNEDEENASDDSKIEGTT